MLCLSADNLPVSLHSHRSFAEATRLPTLLNLLPSGNTEYTLFLNFVHALHMSECLLFVRCFLARKSFIHGASGQAHVLPCVIVETHVRPLPTLLPLSFNEAAAVHFSVFPLLGASFLNNDFLFYQTPHATLSDPFSSFIS